MCILPLFVRYVPGLFGFFGVVPHEESPEGVLEGFDCVLGAYVHVGSALTWSSMWPSGSAMILSHSRITRSRRLM